MIVIFVKSTHLLLDSPLEEKRMNCLLGLFLEKHKSQMRKKKVTLGLFLERTILAPFALKNADEVTKIGYIVKCLLRNNQVYGQE